MFTVFLILFSILTFFAILKLADALGFKFNLRLAIFALVCALPGINVIIFALMIAIILVGSNKSSKF